VIVDLDVVVDGDGDVNALPEKPSHVAVAVKVNDHVNVNDHVRTGISGREPANARRRRRGRGR
jgi:hypothetical protein